MSWKKKTLLSSFENNSSTWSLLQPPKKNMKFTELLKCPPSMEDMFGTYPGYLFMRYASNTHRNLHVETSFGVLHGMFENDHKVCASYLQKLFSVTFNYISAGRNFLLNDNGVVEQYMHSDFDEKNYKIKE